MPTANPLPTDLVAAALARPIVQRLTPERRALLEEDLRAMAAQLREAIEERLRQEEQADDLTPAELEELERAAVAAEDELRAGRCIPAEQLFAKRGIPYPPSDSK